MSKFMIPGNELNPNAVELMAMSARQILLEQGQLGKNYTIAVVCMHNQDPGRNYLLTQGTITDLIRLLQLMKETGFEGARPQSN